MNRRYRLKSSTDFKRVRRTGKSYAHPLAVLIASPNGLTISRFGIIASKALGGAVSRNRAKRRLRAAIHSYLPDIKTGWDIVLIARTPLLDTEWNRVREGLAALFGRACLLDNK
jgi:ribonuclease P protein component